jgi:hypothetical protein
MSEGVLSGTLAFLVMAGLVPAIHVLCIKAWMPGIKPGMTEK